MPEKKPKIVDYTHLCNFRFRERKDKVLLSNDFGFFHFLKKSEFNQLLRNKLAKSSKLYKELAKKYFIKQELDLDGAAEILEQRKNFLFTGASLHIIVVTSRCNQNCLYCHASAKGMDRSGFDMDKKTADKVLERIFETTSPYVSIEFQGGEPLVNWKIVKYIVQRAHELNKAAGKNLRLKLITNFTLLDEDKYNYLIKNSVELCTSLDGDKELHDKNRPYSCGSSYDLAERWIKRVNAEYDKLREKGYIWKPGAITTISKFSFQAPEKIIDTYRALGYDMIYLRPLNPYALSKKALETIGYSADEYLDFYRKIFSYIMSINRQGERFVEKYAMFFVQKIISNQDPNNMDMRNPCGAGIGQLAYNYNGDVYTCDEGRMLSMINDESFRIGNVFKNGYIDYISHPTTRTLCTASCLEGLTGCSDCVYLPYCGVCPIYNYFEQGNIFAQMPNNDRCKINMAILDMVFDYFSSKNDRKILESWTKKNKN